MLILLSPAKTLDFDTPPHVDTFSQPDQLKESRHLVGRLRAMSPAEMASLMGVSDKIAALNVARYAAWSTPFTPAKAKQAALAFNGDVYAGLEAPSLTAADLAYAQDHLRILSGLYGALRPLDLIMPYRLEMGIRLDNERGKDLYAFWGGRITDALNKALVQSRAETVLNLASDEYFKAVRPEKLKAPVLQPVFEDWKGGRYKVISFYAKRARGLMARYAITQRVADPAALRAFSAEGYAFAAAASDERRWVFRRRID